MLDALLSVLAVANNLRPSRTKYLPSMKLTCSSQHWDTGPTCCRWLHRFPASPTLPNPSPAMSAGPKQVELMRPSRSLGTKAVAYLVLVGESPPVSHTVCVCTDGTHLLYWAALHSVALSAQVSTTCTPWYFCRIPNVRYLLALVTHTYQLSTAHQFKAHITTAIRSLDPSDCL